jgi:hypothetical protein
MPKLIKKSENKFTEFRFVVFFVHTTHYVILFFLLNMDITHYSIG